MPPIIKCEDPEPYPKGITMAQPETSPKQKREESYMHVEMMPEFPGGTPAMMEYINRESYISGKRDGNCCTGTGNLKICCNKSGRNKKHTNN